MLGTGNMENYSAISAYAIACRYLIDPISYPVEDQAIIFAARKTSIEQSCDFKSFKRRAQLFLKPDVI